MSLILEDGSIVEGADSYITASYFELWLVQCGYSIPSSDADHYLRKSYKYMQSFGWAASHKKPYKVERDFIETQCLIAYRATDAGGGLDPLSPVETKYITEDQVKVGSISTGQKFAKEKDYFDSFPAVKSLVSPYLSNGTQFTLNR